MHSDMFIASSGQLVCIYCCLAPLGRYATSSIQCFQDYSKINIIEVFMCKSSIIFMLQNLGSGYEKVIVDNYHSLGKIIVIDFEMVKPIQTAPL